MEKDIRQQSKSIWESERTDLLTINAGSLQRIADAAEMMACNYTNLQNQADRYKKWYNEQCSENERMAKRISALRGVITKLKNKAQNGR